MKVLFFAALAGVLVCAGGAEAQQQDCSLKQIASLPIATTADGRIAVPVKINGTAHLFLVGLQSPISAVSEQFVIDARLPTHDKQGPLAEGKVTTATRSATVSDLQIGALDLKDASLPVLLSSSGFDGAGGVLGYQLLSQFDVEIDFAKGHINLYSHDHCPGKVVYWASAFAVAPLRTELFPSREDPGLGNMGAVITQATLDGKPLTVGLSLEPGGAIIALDDAVRLTGLSKDVLTESPNPSGGEFTFGSYRYPFKTLSIGGVAIADPSIDLYKQESCAKSFIQAGVFGGGTHRYCVADLWLRLSELRKLHLYFAFGENKLYVTAADAHK